ncbi:uncharacterized protein LOC144769621 [Lissotriton helveticus]
MVPRDIEAFERSVDKSVDDLLKRKHWTNHNLSKDEAAALQALQNNADLTIKPADKGGGIVVMDTADYNDRMQYLLQNRDHYTLANMHEWTSLKSRINTLLGQAKDDEVICDEEFSFLNNQNPTIPALYGLPKVHKDITNPPMRPIVSSIGSLTEPLSKYADVFLQPLVTTQKAYIKDTTAIIQKLEGLEFNPENQILVTLEIEALYTNIPQNATIEMINSMVNTEDRDHTAHEQFIIDCVTMVLENNLFLFNKDLYRQTKGTSMGATCAPSLACLCVSQFEEQHIFNQVSPFYENISMWSRYIDDVFFIWTGPVDILMEFITWLNLGDDNLNFTSHLDNQSCEFLDLIIKHTDGFLNVELFTKPTDRNTMLHFTSNHPPCQVNNIPFGQFLRLKRNCTTIQDFDKHAVALKSKFIDRGYPKRMVRHAYKRAKYYDRESLLKNKEKKDTNPQPIIFVTNFNQVSNKLKNIINRNWHSINNKQQERLPKPMFSFRRNRTIRNSLVHTYREVRTNNQPCIDNAPLPTGTFPCSGCGNCKDIIRGSTITKQNVVIKPRSFMNCRTRNVIYLISCPCDLIYIGETSREVRTRMNEHRSAIRTDKKGAPLTEHWKKMKHDISDLKWCCLETVTINARGGDLNQKRKKREQYYMSRFNSVRMGLNSREDWERII